MTGVEAWTKMLTEGAKIRCKHWDDGDFLCVKNGKFSGHGQFGIISHIHINPRGDNEVWEFYEEPIITVTLAEAVAHVAKGGEARLQVSHMYPLTLKQSFRVISAPDMDWMRIETEDPKGETIYFPANGWTITRGPS